jgi:exosortase
MTAIVPMSRSLPPTESEIPGSGRADSRAATAVWARHRAVLINGVVLAVVLIASYGSSLARLAQRWWTDSDYIYGFLVPVFAGIILWVRRDLVISAAPRGSVWGLPLMALGAAMRLASVHFHLALVDPLSLVPLLSGIVLFVGGWRWFRWAAPSLAYLVFMVPLPGFVGGLLSHPLQQAGTICSTYLLQTLGIPATSQGNVIVFPDSEMGVVEACSGLRMMMLFFAVSFAAAFLVKRPLLDRIVIFVSAAPVALIANTARIVTTGVLHEVASHKAADALFHDLAGWFMMPFAVLLLWLEMALLARLLVTPSRTNTVPTALMLIRRDVNSGS